MVSYCPNNDLAVYKQYKGHVLNKEKAAIDFHGQSITVKSSKAIIGNLLITDKFRFVLCKSLDQSAESLGCLFTGIKAAFTTRYPYGINSHGAIIREPQIELYSPSGDDVYFVQLGIDAYEGLA